MKLLPPKGDQTRPIIDRVKESIFSVLYKYDVIEGGLVADLFSGTGSFGLEALSRGADFVFFAEQNRGVVETLKKNIAKADFVGQSRVSAANAFQTGALVGIEGRKYDLVFVDPPYVDSRAVSLESPLGSLLLILSGQVTEAGIISVRTEASVNLLDNYGALEIIDRRKWGRMAVTLLRLKGLQENDE